MKMLVEYLIINGIDGLVVVGIIGEFLILIIEEKIELFKCVVEVVVGRVYVIVGIGLNNM